MYAIAILVYRLIFLDLLNLSLTVPTISSRVSCSAFSTPPLKIPNGFLC